MSRSPEGERAVDRDPVPAWALVAALVAVIAWVGWRRYQFLASSPYPFGVDGFFYPVQLRAILESGGLHYPAAPLTFYLFAPLAAVGGPMWAVKVGAAVATALIAAPIAGVARELGAPRAAALAAAIAAATSPASFYFSAEFVKNGVGLTAAAFALWALLWAVRARADWRRRLALAALVALAAWLAHKVATALYAAAAIPVLWQWARIRGASPRRCVALAALAVAALLGAAALAPARFAGVADLGLLGGLLSADADWSFAVLRRGTRALAFGREVPIAAGVAAALWILWRWRGLPEGRGARAPATLLGPGLLAVFAALPWIDASDPLGLGFRLRLIAFVLLALHLGPLLAVAFRGLEQTIQAAVALGFGAFLIAFRPPVYAPPVVESHPALVAAVGAAVDLVPGGDVVVAPERHLVFMYTWMTGAAATQRADAVEPDRRWRLIPLASAGRELLGAIATARKRADPAIPRPFSLHPYDHDGLLLMREAFWFDALSRLPAPARARYERWPTY